jgi:hypothetical protein
MNRNKTLSAAIIAALSIGGTVAQAAGTFDITVPAVNTTPKVATELFPNNTPGAMPAATDFETTYTLDLGEDTNGDPNKVQKPFYVNFVLSGGEWNSQPSSSSIELWRDGNQVTDPLTISFVGVTETEANYIVQAGFETEKTVWSGDQIKFKDFKVNNTGLKDSDQKVQLGITLEDTTGNAVDEAKTLTLIESGAGTSVNFSTGNDDQAMIDVAQSGKKFTARSGYSTTSANLGTITIAYPGTRMKNYSLTDDWDFKGADGVTAGTLTISNGPFSASNKDRVFIELDGSDCVKSGADIAATSLSGNTATWTLTAAQLKDSLFDKTANLCVTVDGQTAINETEDPPTATLSLNYQHRTGVKSNSTLRHIKKNGSICTLYLVTDTDIDTVGYDNTNIRIINRSTASGTLTASLRDQDNSAVFTDISLGTINPNQTITLNSEDLVTKAKQAGHSGKWGRGVLTIGSDLIKMEVFGLVRNLNPNGNAPLLNMSLGASGNGCN